MMNDQEFADLAKQAYDAGLMYMALGMRNTSGLKPEDAAILNAQYEDAAAKRAELDWRLKSAARERAKAMP